MSTNLAWNLGDVPEDARDAALNCAMREGVPVGEWMTRQILKGFSELKVRDQAQILDELGARVTGLARRLDRMTDQGETEALREAVKRLHHGLASVASELGEKANGSAKQVATLADNLDQMTSRFEALRSEVGEAGSGLDARLAQTAGQLTIQISSLASNLEALAEKLRGAQSEAAETAAQMEQRLTQARTAFDGALARHDETSHTFAGDLSRLAEHVDEGQDRAREAMDGLDRRLAALKQDLADLDAAQRSALQLLSVQVENVKSGLAETRSDAAEKGDAVDRRFEDTFRQIREFEADYGDAHRALIERFEKIKNEATEAAARTAGAVEALRSDAAERDEALRRHLAVVDCAFADLSQRQNDWTKAYGGRIDELESQLEAVRSERSEIANALERQFDAVSNEIQNTKTEYAEALGKLNGRIDEVQNASQDAASIYAESLAAERQELKALDARHGEANLALEQKIETLHTEANERELGWFERFTQLDRNVSSAGEQIEAKVEDVRSLAERAIRELQQQLQDVRDQLSGASATFEGRFAAANEQDAQQELRHENATQILSGLQEREAATSIAVAELADKIATLQQKFDDPGAEQGIAAISRSAAELVGRDIVENAVRGIEDRIQSLEAGRHNALSDLKTELLDAAVAAVTARIEASEQRIAQVIEESKTHPIRQSSSEAPVREFSQAPEFIAPFVASTASVTETPVEVPSHSADPVSTVPVHDEGFGAQAGILEPVSAPDESFPSPSEDEIFSPRSFITAARRSAQEKAAQENATSKNRRFDSLVVEWLGAKPQNKLIAGIAAGALIVVASHLWLQRSLTQSDTGPRAIAPIHKIAVGGRLSTKTRRQHPVATSATSSPAIQEAGASISASPTQQSQIGQSSDLGVAALANAGNARAELILGLRAFADKQNPASGAEAAKWLSLAANQGDAIAQYHLGMLYQQGRGVTADAVKAFGLYEASASAGNRDAMNNLGVDFAQGNGTPKNYPEAVRWFSAAANLGLVEAQFDLAVLYERGEGIPQSLANAYRWYAIAAKEGDQGSKTRADALATQISAQDRAAADQFASGFKPAPIDPQANIAPPLAVAGSR